MAKCAREGCKRTAEVAPKLTIPHAIGVQPVQIMLGIKTCRRCCMSLDAAAEARTVKGVKLNSEEYRRVAPRLEHAPMPADQIPVQQPEATP